MTETVKINLWNPHKNQKQITQDKARFKVIVCGRRFGKTTLSIYTLLKHALSKKNGKYFYIAPTYKQAKMIAWSMLLEAVNKLPNELVKKVNESELYVVVGNNSRIDIKGADNPDSLRGVGLHGVVLDEYADMKPNVFNEIIEPALADHKGWAMFIGTPKGFNHFFDLFNQADGQENWSHYRFTSYDNPFLEREELERIKLKTPEDVFMQEYMADFRKHEGLVYKEFDRDFHLYDDEQIRPGIVDRIVAIDFGFTNPTAVLLIEKDSDSSYWVHDEWYKTGKTNTEIIEYVKSLDPSYIYADPAEPDRIEEMKRHGLYVRDVNKDVAAGIDKVRELLKTQRLKVNKRCENLIWELETYSYPKKKDAHNPKEVPMKENDHAVDALRYALFMNATTTSTGQVHENFDIYAESYD